MCFVGQPTLTHWQLIAAAAAAAAVVAAVAADNLTQFLIRDDDDNECQKPKPSKTQAKKAAAKKIYITRRIWNCT